MPRPRAATRALFEDTGTRRCGGKFNVFICKRCGVEILENAYRFAVHISVCKKANDEDRALAAQQLNKSKKSNANTPRNSVPGDVDVYSAGVGRANTNSEQNGPDSGYGVSHRHSESVLTLAARRLRPDGPDDYFGGYGMPSRPGELSGGGGGLGMGSFPYRRSDGYDLYGVEFEGGSGGQPYGDYPSGHMFPGMGRSHDLGSGMSQQGPAKMKPEWNPAGEDQRQGNYGGRYNWRYDPQSEVPSGADHRFGDHQGMPGRGADDFADSIGGRDYCRSGPPPYGSQEPGGPYGGGYPGSYHPEMPGGGRMPSGIDAGDGDYGAPPSDYYSGPPQMGAGFSGSGAPPSSYGYGGFSGKAPYGLPDREEGGSNFFGGPDGMGGGAPGWSNGGMPERPGYGFRPPMDDAPPNYYQGSS